MNQNPKKKSLGRGLSALLDADEAVEAVTHSAIHTAQHGGTSLILTEQIEVNPFQPRTRFDDQAMKELSDSIIRYGLIQPITVRRVSKDKYQLISGERRLKASQIAGLKEIPAYMRLADDKAMLEMALIENTHREDLDAIEISMGYRRLIDEVGLTQEELSEKIGKDRTTVSNYLRLLKLPPVIQLAIREKKITMGHARALINIDSPINQLAVFDKILDESLSVRDTEGKARNAKNKLPGSQSLKDMGNIQEDKGIEQNLSGILSSKVKVSRSGEKGKIVIAFSSEEQFRKIVELLHAGQ
jgi:ParB family transcriptional regulator, chromosome partitioning protein